MHKLLNLLLVICLLFTSCSNEEDEKIDNSRENEILPPKRIKVGAYYFGGWAGKHALSETSGQDWAKDLPSHVTWELYNDFRHRKPLWGWREDTPEIMEKQIELASENGIDFFMFCWYWCDDKGNINRDRIKNIPLHKSLELYLNAKDKKGVKFGILIANHEGAEIVGSENWKAAVKCLEPYFKNEHYIKIEGKPYLSIFNPDGLTQDERDIMQETAREVEGVRGLSIVACGSTPNSKKYDYRTHYNAIPVGDNKGKPERDYDLLIEATEREWVITKQPYIPTVSVGWDPRPWANKLNEDGILKNGWYYVNNTPEKFRNSLLRAAEWIEDNPQATVKEKMVMIYAWNELGEGGYLIPTKGNKQGEHLKMVKEVVYSKKSDNNN